MIEKVVKKRTLNDLSVILDDLAHWLNRTPEERIAAVELLRIRDHGSTERLQRVARVVQRPSR